MSFDGNGGNRSLTGERLHKLLAMSGVASRRACERLIAEGRVTIDDSVVTEQGVRIEPGKHTICVDGRPIRPTNVPITVIALNKPIHYVSSVRATDDRPTVLDLVRPLTRSCRLYPAGRLDYDSEGLVLLTNDGPLTYRLTHPRFSIEKEYLVAVTKAPSPSALARLSAGTDLDGVMTAPARFDSQGRWEGQPTIRVVLHEGRYRQIRRMLATEDIGVVRLARVRIGPIVLDGIGSGEWRRLADREIQRLRHQLGCLSP